MRPQRSRFQTFVCAATARECGRRRRAVHGTSQDCHKGPGISFFSRGEEGGGREWVFESGESWMWQHRVVWRFKCPETPML